MRAIFLRSIVVTAGLLIVLCGLYPLAVTVLAQLAFPAPANGSLISRSGKVIGSEIIAQGFSRPEYFHPRPSAAGDKGYDAANSGGSNLGPTSRKLSDGVKANIDQVLKENPRLRKGDVPVEMVTASASGLDPDISPASALIQVERVAAARKADPENIRRMVLEESVGRTLGFLGEERVNVLMLNLRLDSAYPVR